MSGPNSKRLIISTLIVVAGIASAYLLIASPLPSQKPGSTQPKIAWSEKQIEIILSTGESATKTLTFSSSLDLSNVLIEPVPEIASFLSIQPTNIANVSASQPQQVVLGLAIPSNATLSTLEGTIHLRVGSQTLPATLKVVLHIAGSGAAIFLPPDPGEEGKATLQGIDSDGDGVRDDIQRFIAFSFPDSEKTRASFTQLAETMQSALVDSEDEQRSLGHIQEMDRAQDCLMYIRGVRESITLQGNLRARLLDTPLRTQAWIRADSHASGKVFPLTLPTNRKLGCDFDPDSMRN